LRDSKQIPTGLGQFDAPPPAVKQLDVEMPFQSLDLAGDRRLTHIQDPRRGRKTAFGGDGVEGTELCMIHCFFQ
jgi:hypothetical protein